MANTTLHDDILSAVKALHSEGRDTASAGDIHRQLGASRATLNRHLKMLIMGGALQALGRGRGTKYRLPANRAEAVADPVAVTDQSQAFLSPTLSAEASALKTRISQPLGARTPVSYERRFVDNYKPNVSSLLSHPLAEALYAEGRMSGQQPAGTYARGVLEQLLIDLSWASSRLEGNRYTLLDTRELFRTGL